MRDKQNKKYSDRTDLNQLTHWHLRVMAHQAHHVSYKSIQIQTDKYLLQFQLEVLKSKTNKQLFQVLKMLLAFINIYYKLLVEELPCEMTVDACWLFLYSKKRIALLSLILSIDRQSLEMQIATHELPTPSLHQAVPFISQCGL